MVRMLGLSCMVLMILASGATLSTPVEAKPGQGSVLYTKF